MKHKNDAIYEVVQNAHHVKFVIEYGTMAKDLINHMETCNCDKCNKKDECNRASFEEMLCQFKKDLKLYAP